MKILPHLLYITYLLTQTEAQIFWVGNLNSITTTTTTTTTTRTTTVKTIPKECTKFGQLIPDLNDCSSYYVCLNDSSGSIHPAGWSCDAFGLSYDPYKEACVSESVSGCNKDLPVPECQVGDSSVADPLDARRYHLCIQNTTTQLIKVHRFCPPGLTFDNTTKLCICNDTSVTDSCQLSLSYPNDEATDCLDEAELDDPPFFAGFSCKKPGIFADGYDCNRYYVCVREKCDELVKYGLNCPKGMKFDAKNKECSSKPSTKCVCTCRDDSFNCTSPGLFPDVLCLSQFYECYMETLLSYRTLRLACPDGTFYNPKCQACTDSPHDKCDSGSDSGSDSSSSTYSYDSSVSDSLCKGLQGRFPVKGEPDCYYRCKQGALTKETCPDKCIFDRRRKICRPIKYGSSAKRNFLKQIKFNINFGNLE